MSPSLQTTPPPPSSPRPPPTASHACAPPCPPDLRVASLNSTGVRLVVDSEGVVYELTHKWWHDATSAHMISEQRIGAVPGPGMGRAAQALLAANNTPALEMYGGVEGARALADKWVLHCIEEMGTLPIFLPALYAKATGIRWVEGAAPATSSAARGARQPRLGLLAAALLAVLLAWPGRRQQLLAAAPGLP